MLRGTSNGAPHHPSAFTNTVRTPTGKSAWGTNKASEFAKFKLSNGPSTKPQTEFLCKPIRGIMEEKSMTRNDEGGVIVRGIIEKESLRKHGGGAIIERGASGSPLGAFWEASVWESFGTHLKSFGRLEAEEASGRHLEVRSQKSMPLSAKMQKLHLNFNFTKRF
jgi:hypothetical protein